MRSGLLCSRRRASSSKKIDVFFQIRNQCCPVSLAVRPGPKPVEFEAHILQAQIAPQCTGQQNQFCVHLGAGKTQCLGAIW